MSEPNQKPERRPSLEIWEEFDLLHDRLQQEKLKREGRIWAALIVLMFVAGCVAFFL